MTLLFAITLAVVSSLASCADTTESRAPKLFYVSTTSTTTTYKASTVCFVSSKAAVSACGRRKRYVQGEGKDLYQPHLGLSFILLHWQYLLIYKSIIDSARY